MARKKKNTKVGKQNSAKDSNSGECSSSAAQQRNDTPSQMEVDDQIRNMSVESDLELTSDKEELHQGEATVPIVSPTIQDITSTTTDVDPEKEKSNDLTRPACKSVGNYLNPYSTVQEMKAKGMGTLGRKIRVLANHFPLKCTTEEVTHYDVQFKIKEYKRTPKKSDANLLVQAIEEVKNSNTTVFPKPKSVVFDGYANLFSLNTLKFGNNSGKFETSVRVQESEDLDRMLNIDVNITRISTVPIKRAIEEFQRYGRTAINYSGNPATITRLRSGRSTGHPEYLEAIRCLNVILGMTTRMDPTIININNSKHFTPGAGSVIDIGEGKSLWLGTFKSVRTGWKIHYNVDMANKVGYEEQDVVTFICKYINCRRDDLHKRLAEKNNWARVSKELCGLKIRFERPDKQMRDYRANGLTRDIAQNLTFLQDGTKTNVMDYFQKQYCYKIKYPNLHFLHVGAKEKTNYIPLECCKVKKQACPRNKRLDDSGTANMIRQTAKPPSERKNRILENLKKMNNNFKNDEFAKAFGITVDDHMIPIAARVLPPPALAYRNCASREMMTCDVQARDGKWTMANYSATKGNGFIHGMTLNNWGVLDLTSMDDNTWNNFYGMIRQESFRCGMRISNEPIPMILAPNDARQLNIVERKFMELYNILNRSTEQPPQIILVLAEKRDLNYEHLKLIGDTGDGIPAPIPTQFILKKNVERINTQIAHNVILKINSKIGGINQILSSNSKPQIMKDIMKEPVIFIGADVTHGNPGDDVNEHPSIAAVVGSVEGNASTYKAKISLQYGGQVYEVIQALESMVKELLIEFYKFKNQRQKPSRIVYFRDGVSEGQFDEVVHKELSAIQRACKSLQKDGSYKPPITFVVAQKRHNTRLFPEDEEEGVGRMKNVPPGTVVDSDITHPTEKSFFMVSHEGIQGTSRPTHYHLLSDDNDLSADELQKITYHLCHLYSRCERSVSYPAPTYYAHLAAFRARAHHNAIIERTKNGKLQDVDRKQIEGKIENMKLCNYFV